MRRVLMVTYYFPPLGGIAALRALGFAEHLPSFGWEPIVLAPSNGAYFRDPSLSFPGGQAIRTWSLELSRVGKQGLRAGGDDIRPATTARARLLTRELARRWLYFPDAQVGWYPAAAAAGRRLVREGRFDAIFSSSAPITAHLVARALHRSSGVPWIAEFRDPWSAWSADGVGHRRRRAERLERSIAAEASAVVMTSPSWAAEHSQRWGRDVITIPNGFGYVPPPSSPGDELVVCHLGSYYPAHQDLSSAWKAVERLAAERSARRVRLRLVGEPSAATRAELRSHRVESLLDVTGFLAHEESLRCAASSSVLLAGGPARRDGLLTAGLIPAKLFEYLATGLPIVWLGATPNDGASLLAGQAGCRILGLRDVDGVVAAIKELEGKHYHRALTGLSRRDRTRALAELLDGAGMVPGIPAGS